MRAKLSFAFVALLFAPDALAWGLQTHVFLAQWVLAAAPLADPRFRAAVTRLPRLVLAGACMPDLAIAGRLRGICTFRRSHQWWACGWQRARPAMRARDSGRLRATSSPT